MASRTEETTTIAGEIKVTSYSPVAGFPAYRVGTDGSVWTRWQSASHGEGGGRGRYCVMGDEWRKMKLNFSQRYARVSLYRDGEMHIRFVHILILEAFVGPCPEGLQACHDPDPSPRNNAVSNLRWDTPLANHADRKRHGRTNPGESNGSAKITRETVEAIRLGRAEGRTLRSLSEQHHISIPNVWKIVNFRIWATLS